MQPTSDALRIEIRLYGEFSRAARRDRVPLDAPSGATAGDAIALLCRELPALGRHLIDDAGDIRSEVNVLHNGRPIRAGSGLETKLEDGDCLFVLRAYGGG